MVREKNFNIWDSANKRTYFVPSIWSMGPESFSMKMALVRDEDGRFTGSTSTTSRMEIDLRHIKISSPWWPISFSKYFLPPLAQLRTSLHSWNALCHQHQHNKKHMDHVAVAWWLQQSCFFSLAQPSSSGNATVGSCSSSCHNFHESKAWEWTAHRYPWVPFDLYWYLSV